MWSPNSDYNCHNLLQAWLALYVWEVWEFAIYFSCSERHAYISKQSYTFSWPDVKLLTIRIKTDWQSSYFNEFCILVWSSEYSEANSLMALSFLVEPDKNCEGIMTSFYKHSNEQKLIICVQSTFQHLDPLVLELYSRIRVLGVTMTKSSSAGLIASELEVYGIFGNDFRLVFDNDLVPDIIFLRQKLPEGSSRILSSTSESSIFATFFKNQH